MALAVAVAVAAAATETVVTAATEAVGVGAEWEVAGGRRWRHAVYDPTGTGGRRASYLLGRLRRSHSADTRPPRRGTGRTGAE